MTTSKLIDWQVTEWEHPLSKILTQYGNLEYAHWLQCEINRWYDKNFRLAWVLIKKTTDKEGNKGDVAMFTAARDGEAVMNQPES